MEEIIQKYQEIIELHKRYCSSHDEYQKYVKEGEEINILREINENDSREDKIKKYETYFDRVEGEEMLYKQLSLLSYPYL